MISQSGLAPSPIAQRLSDDAMGQEAHRTSLDPAESGVGYTREWAAAKPPMKHRLARALQFASMGFEPLTRATAATRVGILTATGRYTPEQFATRFSDAVDGKLRLPDREFAEQLVGRSTYQALQGMDLPDWTRPLLMPEWYLTGRKGKAPDVRVSHAFDLAVGLAADPFLLLAFTPAAPAFAATRVGKALNAPFRITTNALGRWFGAESDLAVWTLARSPQAVFQGKARPIFESMVEGHSAMRRSIHEQSERFVNQLQAAGLSRPGFMRDKSIFDSQESRQKIGAVLSRLTAKEIAGAPANLGTLSSLSTDERKAFDVMRGMVSDRLQALVQAGAIDRAALTSRDTLADFFPKLVGRGFLPRDILQSWNLDTHYLMPMGMREGKSLAARYGAATPIKQEHIDGLETFKNFIYASERKLHMEPVMKKWAIRRHDNQVATKADLVTSRIKSGEHAITASLSQWQRSYLKSLVNEFTGHGRGRTMLTMDVAVGEFWDKQLATPLGKRVDKLMRLTGSKNNVDGLADFNITAKLSGMMTHNIFRATVGGNLSSSIVNLSQVANSAVAHGVPQTLRGMLKMHDKDYIWARKNVDLMRDYKAIFDERWVTNLGAKWDDVIFAPFNSAERIIRGISFNVGMENWLKKNGFKSIADARTAGRLQDAFKAAHFESMESSFIYGVLGRSPFFANPLLGPAQSLTSYPLKQAEFLRKQFASDGGAFLRFIGLHGYLIEQANKHLGIAGERVFGMGFLPHTRSLAGVPLIESPPIRLLMDTMEGLEATFKGDDKRRDMAFKKAAANLPIALGFNPLPWVEFNPFEIAGKTGNVRQLAERIATEKQRIGEGYVPISKAEAVMQFVYGRTTADQQRANLTQDIRKAKERLNYTLDVRVRNYVDAMTDEKRDGDKFVAAGAALAEPVWIEGVPVWPEWDTYDRRIKTKLESKRVSRDVLALEQSGALEEVFMHRQYELLHGYRR